jgi:short-subunit dehydrogenase
MVSKDQVAVSNGLIPSQLPANLVAVFTKRAVSPRLYIVGRSQERATRIIEECKSLNPNGEYAFLQADLDLMVNVDGVCEKIKEQEKVINLLCLTQGGADKIMNRTGMFFRMFFKSKGNP